LASSDISASPASPHSVSASSISAATMAGCIRLGVPPPKNTVSTRRGPVSARMWRISATSAVRHAPWSTTRETWELKSQ
jgi:hypothetical protein